MNTESNCLIGMCARLAQEVAKHSSDGREFYLCCLIHQRLSTNLKYSMVYREMLRLYDEDAVAKLLDWLDSRILYLKEETGCITLPNMLRAKGLDPIGMYSNADLRYRWLMAGCPITHCRDSR